MSVLRKFIVKSVGPPLGNGRVSLTGETPRSKPPRCLYVNVCIKMSCPAITKPFRGIPAKKYCHWLQSPVIDIARRRLDFRTAPSRRLEANGSFAHLIRDGRMKLGLTQTAFAEKYQVSLKALRDLEQGKTTASLGTVISILDAMGRVLRA